jgi:CubicO group peptidase (beta-lactamase class C family)
MQTPASKRSRRPSAAAAFFIMLTATVPAAGAPTGGEHAQASASGAAKPQAQVSSVIRPLRDALAPRIDAVRERFDIPALSLVLVRADAVLWAEGFGTADPAQDQPAAASTVYRAGSLAKPFTALATLSLAAAGRIDLDAPAAVALRGFGVRSRFENATAITPRLLLSHHSGLPSDLHKGLWSGTPFTAVKLQLRDEQTAFPPGLVFAYSNLGYSLLGDMVQQVAGEPFAAHLARTLFKPLGMNDTRIAALPAAADAVAVGHRDGRPLTPLPIRDLPAHGLETSAHDLGRFLRALLRDGELDGQQILRREALATMWAPQNRDVPLDLDVTTGLGWFLDEDLIPGGRVVRHGGATLGHAAELLLLPDAGLGVAVLASSGDARPIVEQLATSMLAQASDLATAPVSSDLVVAAAPALAATGAPISPGGHFATDLGLVAIVKEEGRDRHSLCACMTGTQLPLGRGDDGWLEVAQTPDRLPPAVRTLAAMRYQTRRIGDLEVLVADTGDGEAVIGERVPGESLPAGWRARLGRYRVINPDAGYPVEDLRLSLVDGKLCFSYRMPLLSPKRIQMPVRPLDERSGVIAGLGRNRGDTLRFVERAGAEPLLRWSGYLAEPHLVEDRSPAE